MQTQISYVCVYECVYRPRYPVLLSIIRAPNWYLFPELSTSFNHSLDPSLRSDAAAARCTCAVATLLMRIVRAQPFNREFLVHVRFAFCVHELLFMAVSLRARVARNLYIYVYVCVWFSLCACVLWGTLICIRVIFHL